MELAIIRRDQGELEEHDRPVARVVAHDRVYDAHQMCLGGTGWEDIAARCGYASGRIAALAVDAWLQKIAIELAPDHRRKALQLELYRLDALQAQFWGMAMTGDYHAAEVVLKIIARRCKILGFDKPDESTSAAPRTILVTGGSDQYVGTLEALVDGDIDVARELSEGR